MHDCNPSGIVYVYKAGRIEFWPTSIQCCTYIANLTLIRGPLTGIILLEFTKSGRYGYVNSPLVQFPSGVCGRSASLKQIRVAKLQLSLVQH